MPERYWLDEQFARVVQGEQYVLLLLVQTPLRYDPLEHELASVHGEQTRLDEAVHGADSKVPVAHTEQETHWGGDLVCAEQVPLR